MAMDLRKMLSTVEFTEARRGADRNEVASFLRELARGVAALERQLADTTARAEKAEQRLREVGSDDEIRRTLVLAQRTADATLADATSEGQRLVTAAEQRAAQVLAEADAQAEQNRVAAVADLATLRAEGEAEAKQATEELRTQLRQQVVELGERRTALSDDVTRLEEHLAAQRRRLESAVATLTFLVENPDALAALAAPDLTPIDLDGLMEDPGSAPIPSVVAEAPTPVAVSAESAPPALDLTDSKSEAPMVDVTTETAHTDWSDVPVIDGVSSSKDDPITAEVPIITPETIVIEARDDRLSDAMSGRSSSAASHDERRRRFGRSR